MLRFTARDSSLSFIKHQIYGRCNFSSCRISSKIAASSISTAVGPRPTAVKNPCSITDRSNFHGSHNPVFRFLPSVYGNRGMAKKSRNSSAQTQKAGAAAPPDDARHRLSSESGCYQLNLTATKLKSTAADGRC